MGFLNRFGKKRQAEIQPSDLPHPEDYDQRHHLLFEGLRESYIQLAELENRALLVYPQGMVDRAQLRYEVDLLKSQITQYETEITLLDTAHLKYIPAPHPSEPGLPTSLPPSLSMPALNPYGGENGLPVFPPLFVGRTALVAQLNDLWRYARPLPPVVLYGHKLMGKTSVLRNLTLRENHQDILVVIDMLHLSLVDNTAQFLFRVAQEIENQARAAQLKTGGVVVPENFDTTANATIALDDLLELLDRQLRRRRLVLAIDEFELLQDCIEQGRIEAVALEYLESITESYDWLGLILAGYRTLDEMHWNYRSLFSGRAQSLRVGFLRPEEAHQLITQPGNWGFILEYEPELVEVVYAITYGQPYLIQVLCSELVYNWNEHWQTRQGQLTPLLKFSDLEPALSQRFFHRARSYFEGVWEQAGPLEQNLMVTVANWQEQNRATDGRIVSIPVGEAHRLSGLVAEDFEVALITLARRDFMWEYKGYLTFGTELMRRWLVHRNLREV